jgi:hypothetical protein
MMESGDFMRKVYLMEQMHLFIKQMLFEIVESAPHCFLMG